MRPPRPRRPKPSKRFQSTHSLWSATAGVFEDGACRHVSIHALLVECDELNLLTEKLDRSFNPRTPCGVRPAPENMPMCSDGFNPRTPCGVRPGCGHCQHPGGYGFNPRTPCGVRLGMFLLIVGRFQWFQSTHSLWSATNTWVDRTPRFCVSIHALLVECDCARPYTLLLNRANHTLRQPP